MFRFRSWVGIVATVMAFTSPAMFASPAAADAVDAESLIPPPPEGADCKATGTRVICHTSVIEPDFVNEPLIDLPCGTVYETSHDERRGLRWYDGETSEIEKRLVFFDLHGSWSLSPTGEGPTVSVSVNAVSRDVVFPDPFDQDTWPTSFHGAGFTVKAPGYGVITKVTHDEGYGPDEEAHGLADALSAQGVASELCAALGA
jgi:hypothetical protein